ncbi:Vps23 core domain-containing protein [Gymnopilus junonius]|uniref:Vps23 core domain-containing protein n=1 Tax=Gymnopilus junonius TaxID=109634 RepID=A0A9P5TMV5_GYMJU|nr:Vps23 core domain-containing protein [Gymnopilus junonius]
MLVKPGRYLDPSGRCTVEYIQHWERKPEACSLSALFEALQERFSHEPPVYSKPRPVSPPPLPVRPALQPAQPPPLPPHPPVSGLIGQTNPPANYPLRLSPPTVPPPPILAIPIPIVPPPPHPFPVPPSAPFTPHPSRPDPPRAPIPDLLDQDSVPSDILGPSPSFPAPPPRPPNPELVRLQAHVHQKLTSELNSLSQALALDAERLRAQQADLLAGEPAIKDEMARLEAVRDVCVQQAEANIAELRRKGDPEVDELVCATSIVHNQLINLIADDNAIEDTIYHLHRALNAGRIDLERFLRATRVLAEEQFMKRALIEKIQNSVSTMPSSSIAPDWA